MFKTKWVYSTGGPLIIIERNLLPYWGGISNIGGINSNIDMAFSRHEPSDYARACATKRWTERITVGEGDCLVLGGEPFPTALWRNGGETLVVRWVSAPDEKYIYEAIEDIRLNEYKVLEKEQFSVVDNACCILDSSVGGHWGETSPETFVVESAVYSIETYKYTPNDHVILIVSKFR